MTLRIPRLGAVVAVVMSSLPALVAAGAVSAPPASASTSDVTLSMTTVRGSAVDPSSGRVYVAGDDKVLVFNPNGSLQTTIPNVYGAGAPAASGGNLWVPETSAGAVARIDIGTSTVAQTFTVGMPVGNSVAVLNGLVWFTTPGASHTVGLATVDPATGTVVSRGGSFYDAFIRTIPGATNRLLVGEPGLSPFSVYLVDVSGATISVVRTTSGSGSNLRDLEVMADGKRFVTASGAPYNFPEFGIPAMSLTGLTYPAMYYPDAIAYTTAKGGLLAGGTAASNTLFVWGDGRPAIAASFPTSTDIVPAGVQLAPDGSRAYAVEQSFGGTPHFETFDLTATISAVAPSSVVSGVPTTVTVTGQNLGGTTLATVGNVSAAVTVVSPTTVKVDVPTSLGAGAYSLALSGLFGTATAPVTVVANTGATLSGVVRTGLAPTPGAGLTLTSPALGGPAATASDGSGSYHFSGLPYGTYRLTVHDPSGVQPDAVFANLLLVPNTTRSLDVDLNSPPPVSASLARVDLPTGPVRDVEVEPATGRVFVSAGDEVDVFDRDGVLRARLKDQFGADGIALGGGAVWVNLSSVGRINKIDPASATVTASWPTTTATTGGLAYASGKLLFSNGNNQWGTLAQLDPTTGAVQTGGDQYYQPRFTNVIGVSNRAIAYIPDLSSNTVEVLDTTSFPPTSVATVNPDCCVSDLVASATQNRVWSSDGVERRLSDLSLTGVHYPSSGLAVAYSSAMGGIVATGQGISLAGIPSNTHVLDDAPDKRALALDPSGDRAFYVTGQTFVVWSLRPILQPHPVPAAAPGSIAVTGSGLGAASAVTLDGNPATFSVDGPQQVTVTLPALARGHRQIQVTTPWGTTDPLTFTSVEPPGAPTGVSAIPGNGTATVSWTPPADDGGSPVTGYQAVATPGSQTCFTSGLQCFFTGLTNGTAYTFKVKAQAGGAFGPYSAASAPVVPHKRQLGADYDGSGTTDVAIYRPGAGVWYLDTPTPRAVAWGGVNGDVAVPGDYDGSGTADVAVFRPGEGVWYLDTPSPQAVPWGTSGDVPVASDYNGDGTTDLAVFRPSTGTWYLGTPAPQAVAFGAPGDVAVPGDYDGDGKTDVAVYRPATGVWYLDTATPQAVTWGAAGDIPVPGDYDGDGTTDIAVYQPSTGTWYIHTATSTAVAWGTAGDLPVPGDYDGDGTTDLAVYRPSTGTWFLRTTTAPPHTVDWGGVSGDVPVP